MSDPELQQLRSDVLQAIDSVYAEHGDSATQADIEEAIAGIFAGYARLK